MATYGNEVISLVAGGHKKNTDLRKKCARLSEHCTKPASEDEMYDVPKVGQMTATPRTRCAQGGPRFQFEVPNVGLIFKLMCPGLIFKFQTRGLETGMPSIPRTSVSFFFFFFVR